MGLADAKQAGEEVGEAEEPHAAGAYTSDAAAAARSVTSNSSPCATAVLGPPGRTDQAPDPTGDPSAAKGGGSPN